MTAIELDRVEERTEEPAKAWRNFWYSWCGWRHERNCPHCGLGTDAHVCADDKNRAWTCPDYPSKEIAENAVDVAGFRKDGRKYLGAFPVSAP